MPKFEKGSLEMKNYMAGLRAKRGEKRSTSTFLLFYQLFLKDFLLITSLTF